MYRKNSGSSKKTPLKVVEDDQALVLWDFQSQTETDSIQSSVHPMVQMNFSSRTTSETSVEKSTIVETVKTPKH